MSWSIDIISCITDRFVELTATEKRIAQFILDDVAAAAELPIAEMARLTHTSQASVTRFARALGCKDVRELKMRLAQSLAVGQRFILDVPDLEGVQGIYESIIGVLETNRRALDIEALKRAVSWLSDARQILALGMGGGSTICAQEIQYRLFRLGLPVVSQNDGLLVRMMSSAVTPKDVVIVLSLGGYTQEIIESAAIARQYGAKVIAITPAGTPLAEQADLVLPLLVRENDYIFKPSTSRYAMLAMVDVLATELAMANKTQAKGRLRRIKLALDS
ncbi:MurR/RpiR family transcriptional regulator, partial [Klebsiella oxytoca]